MLNDPMETEHSMPVSSGGNLVLTRNFGAESPMLLSRLGWRIVDVYSRELR
jgi:hypothetical protein